jgi:hypothetical protein
MSGDQKIFISYRRDDDHVTGWLASDLRKEFDIFYDRAVEGGSVFPEATLAALRSASVVVTVIGRGWISPGNLQRLHVAGDWARRELELVLGRTHVRLIPVLVDEVKMPDEGALPEKLRSLCERQAMPLRVDSWESDVRRLVRLIKGAAPPSSPPIDGRSPPGTGAEPGGAGAKVTAKRSWRSMFIVALLALIAGSGLPEALNWVRTHISTPSSTALKPVSAAALGVVGYQNKMPCELPLRARPGAIVTLHNTFIRNVFDCKWPFETALKQGTQLRILLIHPQAVTMSMRAAEFDGGFPQSQYQDFIINCLLVFQDIRDDLKDKLKVDVDDAFQVRMYSDLPNMPIDVVHYSNDPLDHRDDLIYHGFFLPYKSGSDDLPAVEFKRPAGGGDSTLFEQLHRYVDEKWANSTPVDLTKQRKRADWSEALGMMNMPYLLNPDPRATP